METEYWYRKLLRTQLVLLTLGILGAASTSRAAITIFFEQVGPDVKVSADGTLDIQSRPLGGPSASSQISISPTSVFESVPEYYFLSNAGTPTATPLANLVVPTASVNGSGAFGYSTLLFVDPTDISGGDATGVTQITWSPSKDFFVIANTTLGSINAGNLQDELAWTATGTGDTISLQTIPEPSSATLLALGFAGVLIRRKRCH